MQSITSWTFGLNRNNGFQCWFSALNWRWTELWAYHCHTRLFTNWGDCVWYFSDIEYLTLLFHLSVKVLAFLFCYSFIQSWQLQKMLQCLHNIWHLFCEREQYHCWRKAVSWEVTILRKKSLLSCLTGFIMVDFKTYLAVEALINDRREEGSSLLLTSASSNTFAHQFPCL